MAKPRIRSIKPEYWTDGKILRLPDSPALFFIAFWNFCEDDGKMQFDLQEIKGRMAGRWNLGQIRNYLRQLSLMGLVRVGCDSQACSRLTRGSLATEQRHEFGPQCRLGWLRVGTWKHQRIDKPNRPDVDIESIQWLGESDSANALGILPKRPRSLLPDRIGWDGMGSDGILPGGVQAPAPAVVDLPFAEAPAPKPKRPTGVTNATWEAYSQAYLERHGAEPVRNKTVNGQLANLVARLGAHEAPSVAAFYVRHNDQFYCKAMHQVNLLVRDAEKLRTEWLTGRQMTTTQARQVDQRQSNANSFAIAAERIAAREREKGNE